MTWPPSDYPVAVNKANATTSTTDHPNHHNALGNVANSTVALVTEYIAALGNVTASGGHYTGYALFDPDNAVWSDGAWWQFAHDQDEGFGELATGFGEHAWSIVSGHDTGTLRQATWEATAESTDETKNAIALFTAQINADGTSRRALLNVGLNSFLAGGSLAMDVGEGYARLNVFGDDGQTEPLIEVFNWDGDTVVSFGPDGSVGGVVPNDGDVVKWDATANGGNGGWVAQAP